jgi:sugar lactone lactonase YvrE
MPTKDTLQSIRPAFDMPMQLGESPTWVAAEAALYWIDIAACALHRLHPDSGVHQSWPLPAEPGCIAACADGGLIVALRSGLAFFDTKQGRLTPFAAAPYDTHKMRFNDGRCDSAGRLWVGTLYEPRSQPLAALYCVERGNIRDSGKRVTVSNGVAFSLDGRTLYQADTNAHEIRAYDYEPADGSIGAGRVFKQFAAARTAPDYGGRPDGAAVDSEGAYWCAMYEGGRLLRLAPDGELLQEIRLPVRCPTMMAFGGADLRTMYVTTVRHNRPATELQHYPFSGYILSLRVDVPGRLESAYVR